MAAVSSLKPLLLQDAEESDAEHAHPGWMLIQRKRRNLVCC